MVFILVVRANKYRWGNEKEMQSRKSKGFQFVETVVGANPMWIRHRASLANSVVPTPMTLSGFSKKKYTTHTTHSPVFGMQLFIFSIQQPRKLRFISFVTCL